jgi:uncharacterized membrane protein
MTLETSKNLGGIGAILMFVGVFPYINYYGIIDLVGLILVLIAMKGLADYYKEAGIFNNALYAFILAIVGVVAFIAILLIAALNLLSQLGLSAANMADWATILSTYDWTGTGFNTLMNFAAYVIADLVVLFVFVLVTAIFLRKSLRLLSAKTGVGMFGTTGLILLIGAILTIIVIGILLIWVAMLILAVSFFSIRTQQAQPPPPTQV